MYNLLSIANDGVTTEQILNQVYLVPLIVAISSLFLNYLLGAFAVYAMAKRYQIKNPALAFLPVVRYFYVSKLAYGGTMNMNKKEWLGVVCPILRGVAIVMEVVYQSVLCVFAYGTDVIDPVTYYNRYLADDSYLWQVEYENDVMPSFLTPIYVLYWVFLVVSAIFMIFLFLDFYRRFKSRKPVAFTILSTIFIDGIFLMAVKNNKSIEEMNAAYYGVNNSAFGAGYGAQNNSAQAPYGNQNPYGNNGQAPYGNPNPYGNGSAPYGNQAPYGNNAQAPYGNQNPYGNNGQAPYGNQNPYGSQPANGAGNNNGWGSPSYPGAQNGAAGNGAQNGNGYAPYGNQPSYGNGSAPYGNQAPYGNNGQSSPFPDFDRPANPTSSPFADLENNNTSAQNGNANPQNGNPQNGYGNTSSSPFDGNGNNGNSGNGGDQNDPFQH